MIVIHSAMSGTPRVRLAPPRRSVRHLSLREREEISRGLAEGLSYRTIATRLGRSNATVCREVARNGGRESYRACDADAATSVRASRPKAGKLRQHPVLAAEVQRLLEVEWSPEQISHRLRLDHAADPAMRISHETIYLSLFVPARSPLSPRLTQRLRTRRVMRYPKVARQPSGRGRLRGMVPIHQRPAEIEGRLVAGHWEGDLVMGRRPSAVATLVERSSRYLLLVVLSGGVKADAVHPALVEALARVPTGLRRSLTWDRGREMAAHAQLTADTGCQVYFCDPRSPWQRPTNENTNRLLRQYLPKG